MPEKNTAPIIGYREDGRPIHLIMGGAPDGDGGEGGEGGNSSAAATEPKTFTQEQLEQILGERVAREKAKIPTDYEEIKAERDRLKAETASDTEKAVAAARAEGAAEVTEKANRRLVTAEAKSIAAGMEFHNPSRAAALIDLAAVKVDENGEPDSDAIKKLLEGLAKSDAYLVKTKAAGPRRDPSQGARPGEKPDGRDAGRAEAERRFGKKP